MVRTLYRNDGTGVFSLVTTIPGDSSCYSYDFGDIDGDGDLDLLGANGGSGNTEILLKNDGTGVFTNVSGQISPNPNQDDNDSKFFDWDNDGDLDLLIARLGSGGEKALGGFIRKEVNGGVYGVGFAANQQAYDSAVRDLFLALDQLEARLDDGRPYLLGDSVTEADWLLFPTLVRFDAVYVGALKCSLKRLVDYPNLLTLTRRLYGIPGVAETVRLDHVKRHYYDELGVSNQTIVPAGPATAFLAA